MYEENIMVHCVTYCIMNFGLKSTNLKFQVKYVTQQHNNLFACLYCKITEHLYS